MNASHSNAAGHILLIFFSGTFVFQCKLDDWKENVIPNWITVAINSTSAASESFQDYHWETKASVTRRACAVGSWSEAFMWVTDVLSQPQHQCTFKTWARTSKPEIVNIIILKNLCTCHGSSPVNFRVFYFFFFFQSLMVGFDFLDVHHYEDAFIT